MSKIEPNEKEIIGKWLFEGSKVTGDSACKRIEDLTQNYLKELAADGEDWSILYQDPEDQRYWEFTYPQSHMHGGGPPALTLLQDEEAKAKYKI